MLSTGWPRPEVDAFPAGPPIPRQYDGKLYCSRCGHDMLAFPVVPYFDVKFVAALLGLRERSVRRYISERPTEFPPRWRKRFHQQKRFKIRVLTADEVKMLQDAHMWTAPKARKS